MSGSDTDALLLFSFGGPEGPDDVMPFLRNVTRGRNVPDERLEEVAAQYERFGGVSPINGQNLALIDALRSELAGAGIDLPVYFGNRNWTPFVADALADIAADGHRRVLALVTSAFGSYSGCRQYREDLAGAVAELDVDDLVVTKIGPYWNHPGFLDAATDRVRDAIGRTQGDNPRLVFTAHSIPAAWLATSPYVDQLQAAARHIGDRAAPGLDHDLVFQSRSGPPQVPWLEPDIVDHLEAVAAGGVTEVVVFPLGFVSDHMEVMFDLDTQAAEAAAELGVAMVRAATVGTHPAFVRGLREIVESHLSGRAQLSVVGEPWPCPEGCCVTPPPRRP